MSARILILACAAAVAFGAAAQTDDALGAYNAMEIDAGYLKGNFATGTIEEMSGGVRIKLLSDDPATAPLPIQADKMLFSWTAGSTTPSTIVMEGSVEVHHPEASVKAKKAEWNFDSGLLVFSGNPEVNGERFKGLRLERMELNMKTSTFEGSRVRADQVPLQRSKSVDGGGTPVLAAGEIRDWPRLIDAIKAEAQSQAPSPGRQILAQMTPENQQLLVHLDTAILLERKEDMMRLIGAILESPSFYREEAWAGKDLSDEVKTLLGAESRDKAAQMRLNRLLLEAAYPFAF